MVSSHDTWGYASRKDALEGPDCRRANGGAASVERRLAPRRLTEESVESGSEKPERGKGRVVATVEVDLAGTRAEREMGCEQIQFTQVGA